MNADSESANLQNEENRAEPSCAKAAMESFHLVSVTTNGIRVPQASKKFFECAPQKSEKRAQCISGKRGKVPAQRRHSIDWGRYTGATADTDGTFWTLQEYAEQGISLTNSAPRFCRVISP